MLRTMKSFARVRIVFKFKNIYFNTEDTTTTLVNLHVIVEVVRLCKPRTHK